MTDTDQAYTAGEPAGSTMRPIYQERTMKCYVVSESELKQLGLANIGITAFAAVGSFLLAFGLDIMKDVLITEDIPENARPLVSIIPPVSIVLGLAFYSLAGLAILWRRSMLNLIKSESGNE